MLQAGNKPVGFSFGPTATTGPFGCDFSISNTYRSLKKNIAHTSRVS